MSRHRFLLCSILMAASCALASFVFACATPFAGLAVFAAATLAPAPALAAVWGTWLLNQAMGYALLDYPISAESMVWGGALGAGALAATLVAASILNRPGVGGLLRRYAFALVAAFSAYELCVVAAGILLGSFDVFTFAIVARLALLNVVWFVGLAVLWRSAAALLTSLNVGQRWSTAAN